MFTTRAQWKFQEKLQYLNRNNPALQNWYFFAWILKQATQTGAIHIAFYFIYRDRTDFGFFSV